jgi:hypothetical protein
MLAVSAEFRAFEKGLYRGQAIAYRTIADWLAEDLAEGRSVEGYIETFRTEAASLDARAKGIEQKEIEELITK